METCLVIGSDSSSLYQSSVCLQPYCGSEPSLLAGAALAPLGWSLMYTRINVSPICGHSDANSGLGYDSSPLSISVLNPG
jgi:hypothetical protein